MYAPSAYQMLWNSFKSLLETLMKFNCTLLIRLDFPHLLPISWCWEDDMIFDRKFTKSYIDGVYNTNYLFSSIK